MSLTDVINELIVLMHHPRSGNYEIGDEEHSCVNCGHEYKGNYCPACGQKATAGRITWDTVRSGVMDVWGLGSRSLIRSLWNLIVRPGRFINDYINGKWQVSFPPVKMLVIVAVSLYFIGRLIYPEFWNDLFDESMPEDTGAIGFIDQVVYWIVSHPEWALLFLMSSLIVPTWFVFRHAPRNTRHTLPQGFFIQVFMCVQFYLWLFALSSVFRLCGTGLELAFTVSFAVVLPLLVYVDYKSLFGYDWWGTLWRMVVTIQLAYLCLAVLILSSVLYDRLVLSVGGNLSIPVLLVRLLCVAVIIVLFLLVIDMINRRTWRTAGWLKALRYPLITLGVVLVMLVVGEIIRPGALSAIMAILFLE